MNVIFPNGASRELVSAQHSYALGDPRDGGLCGGLGLGRVGVEAQGCLIL